MALARTLWAQLRDSCRDLPLIVYYDVIAKMLREVATAYDVILTPTRCELIKRTIDVAEALATARLNDDDLTGLLADWVAFLDNPGLEDGPSGWWQLMNACHAFCTEIVWGDGSREAVDWLFGAASGLPADLFAVGEGRLVRETLNEDIDDATPAGNLVHRLLEIARQP